MNRLEPYIAEAARLSRCDRCKGNTTGGLPESHVRAVIASTELEFVGEPERPEKPPVPLDVGLFVFCGIGALSWVAAIWGFKMLLEKAGW